MIQSCYVMEHVVNVRKVLTLLAYHDPKPKPVHCAGAGQKVDFCGFDIDKDGIHTQK
jgi:hypothetical protein